MAGPESPTAEQNKVHEGVDLQALVEEKQAEAAKAATVGEFKNRFHDGVRQLMHERTKAGGDGAVPEEHSPVHFRKLQEVICKRRAAVDEATDGNEDMRLGEMPAANVLGYNRIGAGRGGAVLNSGLVENIDENGEGKQRLKHTAAHEGAHGSQVMLHGILTDTHGRLIDPLLLYEGHAEITANEEVGVGRRADQPAAVYGEGQDIVSQIIGTVGRGALEQTLTGDGDVTRLQGAFRSTEKTGQTDRQQESATAA